MAFSHERLMIDNLSCEVPLMFHTHTHTLQHIGDISDDFHFMKFYNIQNVLNDNMAIIYYNLYK